MNKNRILLMLACIMMVATSTNALEKDTDDYYLIGSVQDWKDFSTLVQTTPTAKAKMIADIELEEGDNTRIGDTRQDIESGIFYQGVFDGQGHTLTVHYNVTDGVPAPFTHINGATIKNLHVAGTINTSLHHSSVVAHVRGGTNLVSNIWSSLDVITSKNSWDECSAIVSWMGHATLTIEDCLFTGSITCTNGSSYNGCFIGWHQYDAVAQIKNCLSTGTFDSTTDWDATRGCPHTKCYIKQFPSSIPTEMQVTDEQLANGTTVTNLNNGRTGDDAPWVQEGNQPMLKLFALQQDADDFYLLSSASHWKQFANIVNSGENAAANAKMTADIDLGTDQTNIVPTWFGDESARHYHGIFDGQGHTLTVHYNSSNPYHTPFGHTSGATIKNLHVAGSITSTYGNETHLSGLIANSAGSDVIQNVWVSADITSGGSGWIECGAFIGCNNCGTSTITDCLFTGTLTTTSGNYNGCFIGYVHSGAATTTNCLSTGMFTLSGNPNYVEVGTVTNSYVKQHSVSIPASMQVTDGNLANGTTTAALNGERTGDNAPWVQYGSTPMLKIFYAEKRRRCA